jgi:S1-C subfamily serine protease
MTGRTIAILQIPPFGLAAVRLGNSETIQQGDPVVLLASPLGLEGSASVGIVSAIRQLDGCR